MLCLVFFFNVMVAPLLVAPLPVDRHLDYICDMLPFQLHYKRGCL